MMVSKRKRSTVAAASSPMVVGGEDALQASPSDITEEILTPGFDAESSEVGYVEEGGFKPEQKRKTKGKAKAKTKTKATAKAKAKAAPKIKKENEDEAPRLREPATNSDYVPIPWKGRLGYACLNTYLRTSFPSIFCSRTCRIETILKQGKWETSGLSYVQSLGLQNAADLAKLIRWNEKYGIKFLRISSEMFPFASHKKYGYDLNFAKDVLAEAGKLAMHYGHRLTTHPGQFTQLGSPRGEVIEASVRDLEYHSQLLKGLGLKGQTDRDAVMILHMGGMFGDKQATLDRFRENYTNLLSEDVKKRLVLENDDVIWSVHDLLPICKEFNIPMVLDYHHHNIIHDESLREGTLDVMQLFPEIKATWTRKGITQKQHYSEPCPGAFTGREMRKHSPRVAVLPPCDDTMDLMIEAKDKEQAVFELYKTYSIGGGGLFREVIPHQRRDDNRPPPKITKAQLKKMEEEGIEVEPLAEVPDNEVGMGGSERRVYWPPGKEKWLSPMKRVVNRKLRVEMEGEKGEGPAKKPSKEQVTAAPKPAMEKKQAAGRKKAVTENEVELPLAPPLKIKATTREKTSAPLTPPSAYKPSKVAALSVPSLRRGRSASAATAVTTKEVVPPSPESSGLSSPPQSDQEMTDTEEVLTATQKAVFRDTCQPVVNVEKRRRLVV